MHMLSTLGYYETVSPLEACQLRSTLLGARVFLYFYGILDIRGWADRTSFTDNFNYQILVKKFITTVLQYHRQMSRTISKLGLIT